VKACVILHFLIGAWSFVGGVKALMMIRDLEKFIRK
jgi:hypothetical protein